jgi:hypothetical protein
LLINNLEAKVNSGGGGGGVTNPLSANLNAAAYNVTGVGQLTASRLGVSLGAVDTATVADTIGNTWLSVDVGGQIQLGTAGGLGTVRAPTVTPATDSSTKVATTGFVQNAVSGGTTTQVASPVVLTVASTANQVLTGSLAYVVTLPDATTLALGRTFFINVNTSAVAYTCTVNGFTGVNQVSNAQQGSALELILLTNGTSAGTWDAHSYLPNGANFGTSGLVYQGNLTLTGSSAKTIGTSGTGNLTVQTNSTGTLTLNSQGGALTLQSAATPVVSVNSTGVTVGPAATAPVRIWAGAGTQTQVVGSISTVPTGVGNTIFGQLACTGTTTGVENTAVGARAGELITTGVQNTVVGWGAGRLIGATAGNTFLGYAAGANVTGNSNVGIGSTAGSQTATGTGNVSIGTSTLGGLRANDSVLIGRQITATGLVNNEIVIGATAVGAGANTITLGNTSVTTLYAPPLAILGGAGRLLGNTLAVDSSTTPLELQTGGVTRASVTTTGLIGVRPPQVAAFGGSGSYTPPVGAVYIYVECWGAGGGGSGSAISAGAPTIGGAGGNSSVVNTTGPVTVAAASGGAVSGYFGDGGTGGAGTTGAILLSGGFGEGGRYTGPYAVPTRGGVAPRCPGDGGVFYLTAAIGATAAGGYGAGGGGGWVTGQAAYGGGSGGGGGYAATYYTIPTPAAPPSFTVTIGAGGAAGANGTGLAAAQPSAGGSGLVLITAYF